MPDHTFAAPFSRDMVRFRPRFLTHVMGRWMARTFSAALICCAATAHAAAPDHTPAMGGQAGAQNQEAPFSRQPERPTPPPPPVNYACDDGTKIVARFPDSVLAMLTIGDDRYELRAAMAASGVRYAGGNVEFWTHQGTARFTRDGKTTECREAAQGQPAPEAPAASGK